MALRLIEAIISGGCDCAEVLREQKVLGIWTEQLGEDRILVRVLLDAEHSEGVIDLLEGRFASQDGFRLMLFPIAATLPRPEKEENDTGSEDGSDDEAVASRAESETGGRISREELYIHVAEGANISSYYLVSVVLSTVVAAIGLMRDDVAIVIGAMVIAPLLGPNMALALGTTLGDIELVGRSLRASAVGLGAAFGLSVVMGVFLPIDPEVPAIRSRTEVGFGSLVLALASGIAGTLSFTKRAPSALIGVMVAVALLPPLVVCGMSLGLAQLASAWGAFLLVVTNVICVNLAGVGTFLLQGIRPRTWWESDRAKKSSTVAMALWLVLLGLLVVALVFVKER